MPRYIALMNWTEQGIRNASETVHRRDQADALAEKHGGRFEQVYWTVGPYDIVVIIEAPDDESATAMLFELSSAGTSGLRRFVPTTTTRCVEDPPKIWLRSRAHRAGTTERTPAFSEQPLIHRAAESQGLLGNSGAEGIKRAGSYFPGSPESSVSIAQAVSSRPIP